MIRMTLVHFWLDCLRSHVSFSYLLIEFMISVCFTTDDVNLDHLDKAVSAGFLHYKVTHFAFIFNIRLGRDTLRLYKYPVSLQPFTK